MATLALLALVAASVGAMVAVTMAHSQRVSHQRDGLQALYLAETGVEEALTRLADGQPDVTIARTVQAEAESPTAGEQERSPGAGVDVPADSRPVVGSYEVKAEPSGETLAIRSRGKVATPAGRVVLREVRVTCRRTGDGWTIEGWEQLP